MTRRQLFTICLVAALISYGWAMTVIHFLGPIAVENS